MATTNTPRTVETLDTSCFRRQLFQWYFNEKKSMSQVKISFDALFRTVEETTQIEIIRMNERQWDNRAKKWFKSWGVTKAQQGEPVTMPQCLEALPLWYDNGQQLIRFHLCTPEKCNSCESSTKQSIIPQHLRSNDTSLHQQCPTCGTPCAACANYMSAPPQRMMQSYPGPPPTNTYSTPPNIFDEQPSIPRNVASPYFTTIGAYSSNFNFRGHSSPVPPYQPVTGDPILRLPCRPAPPILQSSLATASTGTSAEPGRATPFSRKRSRRSSPEPSLVGESPAETEHQFINWPAEDQSFN
ncbi:MAG: hypothetical protein Q9209_007061 [Squamulea sp. 1 TL-2023]